MIWRKGCFLNPKLSLQVFTQIKEQRKGRITVFYCGNPILAKVLRKKCDEFGFNFRKEVF